jgi:class 3 adenylate cyclase/tetratricopeptide (TPR) repeat protein
MRCPSCGSDNPEGTKFCGECGAAFPMPCLQCGFENLPATKFCRQCGTALKEPPASSAPSDQAAEQAFPGAWRAAIPSTAEGERRQLTVMFCDLVGSTALSAQLDPEELHEVVRVYQATCTKVIRRYEGHIAQHLGDGLLVYFGYPAAHEDDAQRAARAGLGILSELQALNRRVRHPLQVRIGIHTGVVVVGEIGGGEKREQLALGEAPNLAARLQVLAEPDTVVISAATQRLVQGLFECHNLGPQELKGISTPLAVYQVLRESGIQSRFEVAVMRGLTPLVGREQETGLLLDHWERAKAGEGQVVLLSGEPGIGKSRLLQALTERLTGEVYTRVECRCSPFYQNTALYPVIELLQRLLRFTQDDTSQTKLNKLERTLTQYNLSLPEVVPLFASLLSLSVPEHYPPLSLSPQKQKQKTLEALVRWLLHEAEHQPVRFDLEDLHWADPSTLEFLMLLLEQVPTARLLVLLTSRPELRPPWPPHSYVTQLSLRRLVPKQAEVMVQKALGGKTVPAAVLQQVVAKTDGVPLFVEELTKMVLESGLLREAEGHYELMGPLPPLAIPATLHDSLMARLDRLATVREVVQLGATLGREFTYELLRAVTPLDEARLQRELARLVEAELLYQRGQPPQARYLFKHALIQDTAYQSLLKGKRQQVHQQVVRVLEEQFSEIKETQPELLAHHYTAAGLSTQAIPYWQQAGQRASQRGAYVEAVSHLTQGLKLLKTAPETPERIRHELTLQTALSSALVVTKGLGAHEVRKAYDDARELCQRAGETPQLGPLLYGLSAYYVQQEEMRVASELAEQCLAMAERQQDSALTVAACRLLVSTSFWSGNPQLAHEYCERGMARYDPPSTVLLLSSTGLTLECLVLAWGPGPYGTWATRSRRCNAVRRRSHWRMR